MWDLRTIVVVRFHNLKREVLHWLHIFILEEENDRSHHSDLGGGCLCNRVWLVEYKILVEYKTGRQTASNVTYCLVGVAIGIAQVRCKILVAASPVDYKTWGHIAPPNLMGNSQNISVLNFGERLWDRTERLIRNSVFNSFSINVPLLYPLKTSENLRFLMFSGRFRSGTLVESGLIEK